MNNDKLTFLLMAGLPGVGKTTLSHLLGSRLGWYVIDKDSIKEEFLKQGMKNEAAGYAAYEQAFETAERMLSAEQTSVILDSATLHPFILERAREIILTVPSVRLKIILCVLDRYTRDKRLRERPPQVPTVELHPENIIAYFQIFKHLPPPPETLYLFTNRSPDDCLAEVVEYLRL